MNIPVPLKVVWLWSFYCCKCYCISHKREVGTVFFHIQTHLRQCLERKNVNPSLFRSHRIKNVSVKTFVEIWSTTNVSNDGMGITEDVWFHVCKKVHLHRWAYATATHLLPAEDTRVCHGLWGSMYHHMESKKEGRKTGGRRVRGNTLIRHIYQLHFLLSPHDKWKFCSSWHKLCITSSSYYINKFTVRFCKCAPF